MAYYYGKPVASGTSANPAGGPIVSGSTPGGVAPECAGAAGDTICRAKYGQGYVCKSGKCVKDTEGQKECVQDLTCWTKYGSRDYTCQNGKCVKKGTGDVPPDWPGKFGGLDPCPGQGKRGVPLGTQCNPDEIGHTITVGDKKIRICCKKPGYDIKKKKGECRTRHDCATARGGNAGDWECVHGQCIASGTPPPDGPEPTGVCPPGITQGEAWKGCACGKKYTDNAGVGKPCATGYVRAGRDKTRGDQCSCIKWCNAIGYADDCVTKTGGKPPDGNGDGEGVYEFPKNLQEFYDLLMKRGLGFLNRPPGWTDEMVAAQFGKDFEKIRGQEAGARESMQGVLSRQGMLGTGTELGAMGNLAWGTEKNVADTARDLFIANELQKRQDLLDFTGAAQSIFGTGMNAEQLIEAINSARRGEAQNALLLLLQLLGLAKPS